MEQKPRTLLDMLPEKKRETALKKYQERKNRKLAETLEIPYEWFVVGQMFYYGGWEAARTLRRGYSLEPVLTNVDKNGHGDIKYKKVVFSLEEAMMMIDASRKVWSSQVVDMGYAHMVGSASKYDKDPNDAYVRGMNGFINHIKVD